MVDSSGVVVVVVVVLMMLVIVVMSFCSIAVKIGWLALVSSVIVVCVVTVDNAGDWVLL